MDKKNMFEVGKIVYLKSGSPELTVLGVEGEFVRVGWFSEEKTHALFPKVSLQKDKPPPACEKHHETMVLNFYGRPGSLQGNRYACRSCQNERDAFAPTIDTSDVWDLATNKTSTRAEYWVCEPELIEMIKTLNEKGFRVYKDPCGLAVPKGN